MSIFKPALATALLIVATSTMTLQAPTVSAMPALGLSTQSVQQSDVVTVGWKKQKVKRYIRRHLRHYHRHYRPYGGYGYGAGLANRCHVHVFKVPGMRFHAAPRCNHRHWRAYKSWQWI